MAAFSAGGSIIMNMWRGLRETPPREPAKRDIDDLNHCLNALRSISSRFASSFTKTTRADLLCRFHMCGHLVYVTYSFCRPVALLTLFAW